MILGVDRLDYAKGIPERLVAFERRSRRTRSGAQVSLVQISVPSRDDVPEYAELRAAVEELVGRINGRYGEADWVPVRYLYRSYDHRVLAQLYRLADVALVTPLRDGMNLVAKEFIAAQHAERRPCSCCRSSPAPRPSSSTPAHEPVSLDGLAGDIDLALACRSTSAGAGTRSSRAVVAETTPHRWAAAFLGKLREAWRPTA